jgi:hypothetical protein
LEPNHAEGPFDNGINAMENNVGQEVPHPQQNGSSQADRQNNSQPAEEQAGN